MSQWLGFVHCCLCSKLGPICSLNRWHEKDRDFWGSGDVWGTHETRVQGPVCLSDAMLEISGLEAASMGTLILELLKVTLASLATGR